MSLCITATSRRTPSLSSLPVELDTLIFLYLQPDRHTAATLSRVSKRFNAAAEPYVWREINLYNQAQLDDPDIFWRARQHRELREKLERIIDVADPKRWAMVRKAIVVPTRGALLPTMEILDKIAPTLESLTLPIPHFWTHLNANSEHIDLALISSGISFGSLSHVQLGERSIEHVEILFALCNIAPNLASLDVEVNDNHLLPIDAPSEFYPLQLDRDTNILQLRIAYKAAGHWYPRLRDPVDTIIALLRRSPRLSELSLVDPSGDAMPFARIGPIVSSLASLSTLLWPGRKLYMPAFPDGVSTANFASLRRLVLRSSDEIFPPAPAILTNLESVTFDYTTQSGSFYGAGGVIDYTAFLRQMPVLANWLRQHPHLHIVHFYNSVFDTQSQRPNILPIIVADTITNPSGTIRSLCHRGSELLHIALRFQLVHIMEEREGRGSRKINKLVLCFGGDGYQLPDYFEELGGSGWEVFTDLEGAPVPLRVLDQMMRTDGIKEEDWVGRGLEVSAEAWKVATEWRLGQRGRVTSAGGVLRVIG